jgi:O-antigen/teichoic acid export membrane protein
VKVVKQLPIYFIGRIFPAAVAFFGISIYTHLLGPASFGTYALLISVSFLVGMTGFSWLRIAALRMLAAVSREDEPDFIATIAIAFLATAVAVGGVVIGVLHAYNAGLPLVMIVLTAASAVSSGWFELNITVSQAQARLLTLAALQIARSLAALAATLTLIKLGFKDTALLGGFVAGNLVSIGSAPLWATALHGRFRMPILARLFHFGWPSSVAAINNFSATFMRYMLEITSSSVAVGIYATTVDFANQTISLLIGTASLAGQPLAFRARDQGTHDELIAQLRTNATLIVMIGLGATVGLITLAGPISRVYFGSKFHATAGPLLEQVLIISAIGVFCAGLRGSYFEQAFEIAYKTWPLVVIMFIRTITTVGVGFFMVKAHGIIGAAVTVLASDLLSTLTSYLWGRRLIRMPIPVMNVAKTALAALVMSGAILLVPGRDSLTGLTIAIASGVLAYAVALLLLFRDTLGGSAKFTGAVRSVLTRS